MSKFTLHNGDQGDQLKFADMTILAIERYTKNGDPYLSFEFNMIPFVDPDKIPTDLDEMKVKTWRPTIWDEGFQNIFLPSAAAQIPRGIIKNPDDLITDLNEKPKNWFVSYQTPLYPILASQKDINYAKSNNRFDILVVSTNLTFPLTVNNQTELNMLAVRLMGGMLKKSYPIKIVNVYKDLAVWEADAKKAAATRPATPRAQPTKTQNNPEYIAALTALPIFVNNSGLDLAKLEASLQAPPLNIYFNMNSPEVKHAVAESIVRKYGNDTNAIKGLLLSYNGYLDFEGDEIQGQLSEVPF